MRRLWRFPRAALKQLWLVVHRLFLILGNLLAGRLTRAANHTRELVGSVHEDLTKTVVALQRLLPFWGTPGRDVDRILIVKLDRIGDMVNTTPVFDALRGAFPQARLDIVAHPGPLALLEGDTRIGERIPYKTWMYHPLAILPGGPRLWALLLRLLWRRYPLVVYLRGSVPFLWLGLTSRLAAARFVVGEPVIDRYLKALEPILGPTSATRPRLPISAEAAVVARQVLGTGEPHRPRVVIHATASAAAKMWPAERFAALADRLSEEFGARVFFLGGPEDRAGLEAIAALARQKHDYQSTLRLPQVTAVLARCDLFIGNDSGLSHIAAAVGTRLIVLWGPANLSMARPAASPEDCTILYHELPCRSRCPETSCVNPSPSECLLRTQTDDVVEAARRFLAPSPGRRNLELVAGGHTIGHTIAPRLAAPSRLHEVALRAGEGDQC
jgi:ADP-heptose:LPS heptosyltransferase